MNPPDFHHDLEIGFDYYQLLNVEVTASEIEIFRGYRDVLAALLRSGGDPDTQALLKRAKRTLLGPEREAYDVARLRKLTPQSSAAGARSVTPEDGEDADAYERAQAMLRERRRRAAAGLPLNDLRRASPPRSSQPTDVPPVSVPELEELLARQQVALEGVLGRQQAAMEELLASGQRDMETFLAESDRAIADFLAPPPGADGPVPGDRAGHGNDVPPAPGRPRL